MTMTVVEHGVDSASVQTVNMISSVPHQWSPHWHQASPEQISGLSALPIFGNWETGDSIEGRVKTDLK